MNSALDSSFGEGAGHTDVRGYSAWINSILVPEPGSWLLGGAGLLLILAGFRRRKGPGADA